MADEHPGAKVAYPYMTSGQWHGIRERLRKSVPKVIDVDWIMAALGTSEKSAQNLLPQLRAVGLIGSDGKPVEDLIHDVRDDDSYAAACRRVVENLYPPTLLDSWPDPKEDAQKVAAWFMRNAGTGAATAKLQARLYLLLLGGEVFTPEESAKKSPAKRAPSVRVKRQATSIAAKTDHAGGQPAPHESRQPQPPPVGVVGPALHIDMQIHISADASDNQIDRIFKSMAKHLKHRE